MTLHASTSRTWRAKRPWNLRSKQDRRTTSGPHILRLVEFVYRRAKEDWLDRILAVDESFSLQQTCAPVDWGGGRWPNEDWIDGHLLWVGWEGDRVVFRRTCANGERGALTVGGDADPAGDPSWARKVLGIEKRMPSPDDPVIAALAEKYPGMRPIAAGSIFDGLIDSIVGQSITVKAAAVVSARVASYFHPGIERSGRIFWPAPRPVDLANADPGRLRRTGLTWKRAEALVAAGRAALDGSLNADEASEVEIRLWLRRLPLVGPWTVESTLIWGIGDDDAFPMGDVALLRAARRAYDEPDMTMKQMGERASSWKGHRGWATRLIWLEMFGPARSYEPEGR